MAKSDSSSSHTRRKILVVDDEPDILDIVELVLQAENWSVFCARDGDQAVALAKREHPTAILLDARMPDEDGFTTLARLQHDPMTRSTPVILMSAMPQTAAVPEGFVGVIAKPFDPLELPQRIRRILSS